MKLYYSGAKSHLLLQSVSEESLGGYISTSLVSNTFLNNFFSDISKLSIEDNKSLTKLFVLKNETGGNITDIQLYFVYPSNCLVKFLVGAVIPSLDSNSNPIFETIHSPFAKPLQATFHEADGISNQVNLGDLDDGAYLGLWLRRELLSTTLVSKTNQQLQDDFTSPPEKTESINIVFSW